MAQKSSSSTFLAALLLIVAMIVAVFIWQPMSDNNTVLETDLDSTLAAQAAIDAEVAGLVALEANLPVAEIERARILASVPIGLSQDELIDDLDSIAKSAGVDLSAISFSLQQSQDGASMASINCSFSGPYEDLLSLMKALEGNDRLFRIASIGVQLGGVSEEGVQQMAFTVTVEAYFQ